MIREITIHVELFGFLEQFADHAGLGFSIRAGSTLKELLHMMAGRLGVDFRRAVLDKDGNLNGGVALMLDRELIPPLRIAKVRLWREGALFVVPMMEGG